MTTTSTALELAVPHHDATRKSNRHSTGAVAGAGIADVVKTIKLGVIDCQQVARSPRVITRTDRVIQHKKRAICIRHRKQERILCQSPFFRGSAVHAGSDWSYGKAVASNISSRLHWTCEKNVTVRTDVVLLLHQTVLATQWQTENKTFGGDGYKNVENLVEENENQQIIRPCTAQNKKKERGN